MASLTWSSFALILPVRRFHIWPRSLVGILSEVESECFPEATITLPVVLRDGDGTHEENSVDRQPQNFPQIIIKNTNTNPNTNTKTNPNTNTITKHKSIMYSGSNGHASSPVVHFFF